MKRRSDGAALAVSRQAARVPLHRVPHARGTLLAMMLALVAGAAAGDEPAGARLPMSRAYAEECAACHVAYPPRMLPADSWRRIMDGLGNHYGTDASLDPGTVAEIASWLEAGAATGRRARETPPEDRITRSRWFVDEHDEVSASTWSLPAVKSRSNCAACHGRAAQGVFDEHDIRIPR